MSLDSKGIEQKINRWRGFQEALRDDDRDLFKKMMDFIYRYAPSIQAMPAYEQDLAILLSIIFDQHKAIQWLKEENERLKKKLGLT